MSLLAITTKPKTHSLILATALLALSSISTASELTSSKSISYSISEQAEESTKKQKFENTRTNSFAPLQKEGYRIESGSVNTLLMSTSHNHSNDFSIYDVQTNLISDNDYDGFYHRFSVSIDADTVYSTAYVYAKLYLSYEGGPWNYYASSAAFHIYGDSPHDAFVIETELAEGFTAGHYDIRIELYDADRDEWVLSYGPYDNDSLSTLPLEDSYYDKAAVEVIHSIETEVLISGHGSLSMWLLPALGLMIALRRFKKTT